MKSTVRLNPQGNSSCTCPILSKCKHIHKVLYRIRQSRDIPIPPPSAQHLERVARRERLADQMEHASVYVAFACKSELNSGSDYYRSQFVRDKYDQEVLGVFFSLKEANLRAKNHVREELGHEVDDDDEEEDDDDDDDYGEDEFDWDDEDFGPDDNNEYNKVWVDRFAVEDASRRFHT
ncbi:hypothetical protein FisN_2Hh591 [Fistulifera solaris]|uniref:SWIM-type domain-containing protein n=1 Tax=Fistulifera solaris TaxID=1519565 RepID=A0A1Z5JGF4_FISSO|nr:hypothetical protein FisN_2Hh591 [Fistulifera solaris]|eukprot:GAX13083.1 hypothetical protein FisN_2Hh591 [Fistulifera solaris]